MDSPWNSPGQNTGVGILSLLQRIFPTQGSSPGLPHCRRIFYQLSHKGSPRTLEWVAYHFSRDRPDPGIELGLPHCRWILYQLSYQGRPHTFLDSLVFYMVDHAFLLKTISSLDLDATFSWVCLSPLTVPTQFPLLNLVLLLLSQQRSATACSFLLFSHIYLQDNFTLA